MRTANYRKFLKEVLAEVNSIDRDYVKNTIGDSTNNNRTLTISQVIRYLTRRDATQEEKRIGRNLNMAYNKIKGTIKFGRFIKGTKRTDAADITEFVRAYRFATIVNNSVK